MTKTFIFVRHGEFLKTSSPTGKSVDNGLTTKGLQQVHDAAEWVSSLGIEPDVIVYTKTARTEESANIIFEYFGGKPRLLQVKSGFRDMNGLHRKWTEWTAISPARIVLFCGHHSSQQALAKAFGLQLHSTERGVVLVGLPE